MEAVELPLFEMVEAFDASKHRQADTYTDYPEPELGRVRRVYDVVPIPAAELLDAACKATVRAIDDERDRRLSAGAPYAGRLIDVSDRSRANLSGMAVAAMAAQAGHIPWSEAYAAGWIAVDNTRVALPTPADGLALAASVGDWCGRTIQHARTLKDIALTSIDPAAVDWLADWPD